MSSGLTIAGGAFQLVGLFLVFAELAAIRAHEWGKVPPWTKVRQWLRSMDGRLRSSWLGRKLGLYKTFARIIPYTSSATLGFGGTLTLKKRPAPLDADAGEADRIAWLERYVQTQDEDLERLVDLISQERAAAVAEAKQSDEEIRQEIEARNQQRQAQLRWSIRRQAIGTVCVLVGVALTTLGAVA